MMWVRDRLDFPMVSPCYFRNQPDVMNKDILFTAFFCALYLISSANGRSIEWSPLAGNCVTYFLRDTVGLPKNIFNNTSPGYPVNDSVVVVYHIITGACRQFDLFRDSYQIQPVQFQQIPIADSPVNHLEKAEAPGKRKLLHGDVSYDYSTHASPTLLLPAIVIRNIICLSI
jgi:hypothetical protein